MMKRLLYLVVPMALISLLGCVEEPVDEPLPITAETVITMENLDEYMYRDDVQYVDLRNFDAKFAAGYIDGFEQIPFFDYLDYRVFERSDTFAFEPSQIIDQYELERLFKQDKAIFLYADGCMRSEYVQAALWHLGYERVFSLGGFYEYLGEYKVLGTGDYRYGDMFYTDFLSETTHRRYFVSGELDLGKYITSIRFDIVDSDNRTLRGSYYDGLTNYNEQLTILEEFIVMHPMTMNELYDLMMTANTSGSHDIPGYELGFDDDLLALIETLIIN